MAVAGRFYPESPAMLRSMVERFVEEAVAAPVLKPKALIAPHAGYVYSGPIAGSAYRTLADHRRSWGRVVIVGPSHFVGFTGIALPAHQAFATPLGELAVDGDAVRRLSDMPGVITSEAAHQREHGIEVHLPFLQVMLDSFTIVPLVTGDCDASLVATVIGSLLDDRTLIVISSDLSHFHDYDTAAGMDRAAATAIESLDPAALSSDQACGQRAIQGLLLVAAEQGWRMTTLDLRSSGDTAGSRDRVVGYGAWVAG